MPIISSPGPAPTSSPPEQVSRSRKEAVNQSHPTGSGRAGSAGGIVLSREQTAKNMSAPTPAKAVTPAPPAKEATTAANAGPNRPRRRPRKLNREPISTQNSEPSKSASTAKPTAKETVPPATITELETLKSRVRDLEAKVEELYKSGAVESPIRSPRRRGKGRKQSAQRGPTTSSMIVEPAKVEDEEEEEEEADEELFRLEDELEDARHDLETYRRPRSRPRVRRHPSPESDIIEEIPREAIGGMEDMVGSEDRQVTLTGNYRIPLPTSVSMSDVKNIQSGVTAAQNVARTFLEQRRTQQATQTPRAGAGSGNAKSKAKAKQAPTSSSISTDTTDGQTWSEWFGGYSMAISKAVKNIEAEAALESQRAQPAQSVKKPSPRSSKTPTTSTKMVAKAGRQRPPLKQSHRSLSSDQVQGLMG